MKNKSSRKNITQPADWWDAFEAQAMTKKQSLSEWMGDRCRSGLKSAESLKLSPRRPANRPKKEGA